MGTMLGTFFVYLLGTMYTDFQEPIFEEISRKMLQTFHCRNVTPSNLYEVFFSLFLPEIILHVFLCSLLVSENILRKKRKKTRFL